MITLEGDFDAIHDKELWLQECSQTIDPATCVDVRGGSIIVTIVGPEEMLQLASSYMQSLELESFGTYTVTNFEMQDGKACLFLFF